MRVKTLQDKPPGGAANKQDIVTKNTNIIYCLIQFCGTDALPVQVIKARNKPQDIGPHGIFYSWQPADTI